MEKYESKQHQIRRPASQVYGVLSDFTNFTPLVKDKVEGWQAGENSCSFRLQGITMKLMIIDKEPYSLVKMSGGEGTPLDFTLWIQLKEVAPYDTRLRLVLHADLNFMMKMMIGSRLREGIDQMAAQIAAAFNGVVPAGFDPEKLRNLDPREFTPENFNVEDLLAGNNPPSYDMNELAEHYSDELSGQPIIFPDPSKPVS